MSKEQEEQNNIVEDVASASNQKIDAIKDIIFGDNIKQYELEFETIKKELEASKQEFLKFLESTKKDLEELVSDVNKDLESALENFRIEADNRFEKLEASKTDRESLGQMLKDMGEKLQS